MPRSIICLPSPLVCCVNPNNANADAELFRKLWECVCVVGSQRCSDHCPPEFPLFTRLGVPSIPKAHMCVGDASLRIPPSCSTVHPLGTDHHTTMIISHSVCRVGLGVCR